MRIGFMINPIAGMGGRVGLKGTDGVLDEARARGATPVAPGRAAEALRALADILRRSAHAPDLAWLTGAGALGEEAVREAGFSDVEIVYGPADRGATSAADTEALLRAFLDRDVDLILFCGGDGTARDIAALTGTKTPILGIPSGVKMFSGVFGTTPAHTAEILAAHLAGRLTLTEVEVLDLDEEKYRAGDWAVRLYHAALTPFEPAFTQASKTLIAATSDADAKSDIAKYLVEEYGARGDVLLLLGAGSTVAAIGAALSIKKTLLGIDAVAGGKQVGTDLDERGILALLDRYKDKEVRLVLSPIGAQGFVLGRGTAPLGTAALRRIGPANLIVVATPPKLAQTQVLHVDTGDPALDKEFVGNGYLAVVTGYGTLKTVKLAG